MNAYKTLVAFTLIVALLSACGITPAGTVQPVSIPATEATTIGTVNTMQNLVEVGSPGNLIHVPVSQAIYDNDAIRVTSGGIALLNFLDTTVLKLFNDTSLGGVNVEISESTNKRLRMKLERGGLSGQVVKDSGGVGFEMPNGTHIYILGTSFYVTYDPTTDIVSAGNFDGTVAYQVPGQAPQFLPKGNLIDILPGGVVQVADMPFDINAFDSAAQANGSPIQGLEALRPPEATALPPTSTPTPLPTSCPIPEGWQAVIVQPADTFDTIASRYGSTAEILAQGNCLNTPDLVPGMVVYAPPLPAATPCSHPAGWVTYIVQRGDNLYQIGLKYGVTVTTLQSGNCMDSSQIYTGQRLYVPNVLPRPSGITISGNAGVGFATLSYVDGTAKIAAADANGNYSLTVSYNWTGTVTPSKTGYTFSPASRSYSSVTFNQTAQNYAVIVPPYALTVSKTGSGTITSIPAGIDCGSTCTYNFAYSTTVTLTATPALGYSFANWSGACTGNGTCTVTMDAVKSVTANFVITPYTLAVSKIGAGTVTSVPAGIDCGSTCTYNFPYSTTVTLTAAPSPGYSFTGWGGSCTGPGTCTVTMDTAKFVTANFIVTPYTLTVSKTGPGTVTSIPAGINCGPTCSYSFAYFTSVTLTATPPQNYTFTGWSGACFGTGTCTVTMNAAKSVSANFAPIPYALTVSKSGANGGGTVASVPAGIFCGSTCTYNFPYATTVTLTATPPQNYAFTGWSGACTNTTGICTVTMDAARSVTANFALIYYPLTVSKTGQGTVTSVPVGIDCGQICTYNFPYSSTVTLTATPAQYYTFTGWSGACTNTTGTCTVTMDTAKTVTANFTFIDYQLTVSKNSSGTITSSPAGIKCGSACTYSFPASTQVTLTAVPSKGYVFQVWTGACEANYTTTCTLTMDASKSVAAIFGSISYALTVNKSLDGRVTTEAIGIVTSDPSGINCGSTCTHNFSAFTSVTLTAMPVPGDSFTGWSGACTNTTGTCTVTMNAAQSVTANFTSNLVKREYDQKFLNIRWAVLRF